MNHFPVIHNEVKLKKLKEIRRNIKNWKGNDKSVK